MSHFMSHLQLTQLVDKHIIFGILQISYDAQIEENFGWKKRLQITRILDHRIYSHHLLL